MEVPRGGLSWLEDHNVSERIRAIATGEIPLSHDGLDALAMSNGREHLRELLITHGVLPERDRYLAAYERWAKGLVATVDVPADRRLITAYLRWHHGPRLARFSESGELTESRYSVTRSQANIAVRLLAWLRAREHRSRHRHPRRHRHLVRHGAEHPSAFALVFDLGHPHTPTAESASASGPSRRTRDRCPKASASTC